MLTIDTHMPKKIRKRLKEEYSTICSRVPDSKKFYAVIKHVHCNNRLRTSAGRAVQKKYSLDYWYIELNPKYYQAYGLKRVIGTYRHELAHVAAWVFYGEPGHTNNFKRLCELFGGTMNPSQGKHSTQAYVTNEFLETTPKWRYTCPGCGVSFPRKQRVSAKKIKHAYCVKCHTPARKFRLEQLR